MSQPDFAISTVDGVDVFDSSKVCPLEFETPLALMTFAWPHMTPHDWQKEISNYTASGGVSQDTPLFLNLVAANGAGKDSYIIAPFAVWLCATRVRSRCIITSASFNQIKTQTFAYIRNLAMALEEACGFKMFRIVENHITCLITGSEIICFVTDESGKGEGYHPFPDYADAQMAIIINEAKSIKDHLWTAFRRFSGYTHWLEISSPGPREGHFYRTSTSATAVKYPSPPVLGQRYTRFITAFDCPNISKVHIRQFIEEEGEHAAVTRSSIFSEFTDFTVENIIQLSTLEYLDRNVPAAHGDDIGIGLDVAGGGDENSCYVRQGNQIIFEFHFRERDTTITPKLIDSKLQSYKNFNYTFNADNGGISQAIIDALTSLGWRVSRRNNQSRAFNSARFSNLGAEMYFHTKRLFERHKIPAPGEGKLRTQLSQRRCKPIVGSQIHWALESKPTHKSRGLDSPDRADAFVLCFFSYRPEFIDTPKTEKSEANWVRPESLARGYGFLRKQPPQPKGRFTLLRNQI